jgi:hypothetical protein
MRLDVVTSVPHLQQYFAAVAVVPIRILGVKQRCCARALFSYCCFPRLSIKKAFCKEKLPSRDGAGRSHVAAAPMISAIVVQASSLPRLKQAGSLHHNMVSQHDRRHLRLPCAMVTE